MGDLFGHDWSSFPRLYAGHLGLSLSAIVVGLLISLPLGVLAARSAALARFALGSASIVQTIPGLALLALMVPLLGGRIGFWPAFVALTLYSVLPLLRNTIVGLRGVDPDVREAALAVGMTERQRLFQVDLPLAAPVIIAGLRTAAVWTVGAATLATPVGAESLGGLIFQGLQTRNWASVIAGCLGSAVLALGLDQLIALFEIGYQRQARRYVLAGLLGLAVLCLPVAGLFQGTPTSAAAAGTAGLPLAGRTVVLGAKTFTEQYVLADAMRRVLERAGARVEIKQDLGSNVAFDALLHNDVDLYVDYTGTVWTTIMHRDDVVPRDRMLGEIGTWLAANGGATEVAALGFENAYAFATSRATASRLGLRSIADLAGKSATLASDPEFLGRPDWVRTRDAYGLGSLQTRQMDSTFMYDAVATGSVDVITAYTTDGRIDAFDLILLTDEKSALPPYDAFVLASPKASKDAVLIAIIRDLASGIDNATMRHANAMVDLERRPVAEAGAWLFEHIKPPPT